MVCVHQCIVGLCPLLWTSLWWGAGRAALQGLKKVPDNLNVETEDFRALLLSGVYVDKSLLINETLKCDYQVLQITRPRKWGKTLNLDMLRRFFEIEVDSKGNPLPEEKKMNPALFKGGVLRVDRKKVTLKPLKISGWDDVMGHMGKHPVIYVSFKDVKGRTYQQFEEKLKNIVMDLFLSYPCLQPFLDDDNDALDLNEKIRLAKFVTGKVEDEDFICCFEFLSMLLYKHFKSEVCLFIDDYDVPIMNAFLQFGDKNREFDSIVIMLRVMFENAFKENQYLLKGIISGTLNFFVVSSGISQYHFVGFNTVLDQPFSEFFGFTQKDIGELMGRVDILFSAIEIRKWYGGLHVNGVEIYNPYSVMKCLARRGKYDYYLQRSYSTDLTRMLDKAFLSEDLQEYFHLLIEGKEIVRSTLADSVYLRSVSGDFYSIFVHTGYLERIAPVRLTDRPIWRMRIPNMDVRAIFADGVRKWVTNELKLTEVEYQRFINHLVSKQMEKFKEELELLMTQRQEECGGEEVTELYYHNLVAGMVSSLAANYLVESIKEVGQRRGGNLLVPIAGRGEVAVCIEYRIGLRADSLELLVDDGLSDLVKKPRPFSLKMREHGLVHVRETVLVSIAFQGPNVSVKHKVSDNSVHSN